MLVIFSSKNSKRGHKLELAFICLLGHAYETALANIKMERQGWPGRPRPEKLLMRGRSGTQYVAMVTKLLSLWNTFSGILLQRIKN